MTSSYTFASELDEHALTKRITILKTNNRIPERWTTQAPSYYAKKFTTESERPGNPLNLDAGIIPLLPDIIMQEKEQFHGFFFVLFMLVLSGS